MQSRIFPDRRKNGKYVIIEFTGYKMSGTAKRIWPKALLGPRKPRQFDTYLAAAEFIKNPT